MLDTLDMKLQCDGNDSNLLYFLVFVLKVGIHNNSACWYRMESTRWILKCLALVYFLTIYDIIVMFDSLQKMVNFSLD